MKQIKVLLVCICFLPGCASISKNFSPVDNEALEEWQIEGSMIFAGKLKSQKSYFRLTQISDDFNLSLNRHNPVADAEIELTGNLGGSTVNISQKKDDKKTMVMASTLQQVLPVRHLNYWLRALPATGKGAVRKKNNHVFEILEAGWRIRYQDFMQVSTHFLPRKMTLTKNGQRISIKLVRGEIGFLSHPCDDPDNARSHQVQTENVGPSKKPINVLVPKDDSAPVPRWVSDTGFCQQLIKVHGKVPDPRIGLYGPDSMMWRLSSLYAPSVTGSGRALLLQMAHPWITAGIDDHSEVRDDPLERGRRTFINTFAMVFGSMPQVMEAANRVHKIHNAIQGKMQIPSGAFKVNSEYRANEVSAMIWVHSTLWETMVYMYEKQVKPLTQAEKEQFYQETKLFAMVFGIPEKALPETWDDFVAYNHAMWRSAQLTVTKNAVQLKKDLFKPRNVFLMAPLWGLDKVTAVHLPERISQGYGMEPGRWERFHSAWIMGAMRFSQFVLPNKVGQLPARHEANARLKGKRVGPYQRYLIKLIFGRESLVN